MTAQLLFRRTWTLRYAATAAGLSSPRSPWAGRGSLGSRAAMAVQGQPPLPAESQMLEAEEESRGEKVRLPLTTATADGEQIVEWKKKLIKNQRKESRAPDDPADNLMMEMPFAETEIEAELSSKTSSKCKAYVKKKRKRITAKESEEDNVIKKKKKNQDRPNYFISVPVTDPKIVDDVQTLQKTIIQKDNRLSKAMIYYGSFHVTLLVMNLPNEEAIGNAVGAFLESRGFIEELLQGKPVDLSFQGTDHFRNQVGYVKLTKGHPTDTLLKIAVIVKMAFQEKGIFIDDKTFRPHLTFMKLSKSSKPRKQGVKRIDPTVFADFKNHYFGDELMKRLDLCSMLKKKQPNGYYHCEASIVVGEKKRAEPDDAELLSLSKRLVENAVLKAVQQYLEETQNKNRQNDCGSPVKTEEVAIGNSKKSENDIRE